MIVDFCSLVGRLHLYFFSMAQYMSFETLSIKRIVVFSIVILQPHSKADSAV